MRDEDFAKLVEDSENAILRGSRVAILGATRTAAALLATLVSHGLAHAVVGVYSHRPTRLEQMHGIAVCPIASLANASPECLIVAADASKEAILSAALPHITGAPKVIVAGYAHFVFRDPLFDRLLQQLAVPSLANGYPHSLVHLFQCLQNAARLGLRGVVAELGMFKGGTTMFLSLAAEALGAEWRVVGFDTFNGFPARRSPLDMYDEPGCVFTNVAAVHGYLRDRSVEIVEGDIADTCQRLAAEDLVLTFVDTDNYTATSAALAIVRERTVRNGAIVFDHFAGADRFRYTLGERFAASMLLSDPRYFNLHGTGVFVRQL